MKFKVNGEEVFASTGGRPFDKNKPLIIFIHGSGLTHMCWVLQTRYFAFHGYSVLALDLPGHGLSAGKSLASIEDMADWINDVIESVGYKNASNLGGIIGSKIGPIFKSKKIIKNNLKNYLPNSDDQQINNIINKMWENYGRIFAEYIFIKDFRSTKLEKNLKINGIEYLDEIKKNQKPVIFVSGHFNNFELMAMQLENMGIDLAAIYRPLNNFLMNKKIEKIRVNHICKKQVKKGKSGTREILKYLNQES